MVHMSSQVSDVSFFANNVRGVSDDCSILISISASWLFGLAVRRAWLFMIVANT